MLIPRSEEKETDIDSLVYDPGSTFTMNETLVPNSCIESAELIIQVYHATDPITWDGADVVRDPHVWAEFHRHRIDITAIEDFHSFITMDVESYVFESLPGLGEGICLVNKLEDDEDGNMHFGAVVRTARRRVYVSNMDELSDEPVTLVRLVTELLYSVDDFRVPGYTDLEKYVIGKLTVTPDPSKIVLGGDE